MHELRPARLFLKHKIEYGNAVNGFEFKVPVAGFGLLADGKGGVKNGPVFEEILLCLLHLDNDFLAVLAFAINVEHRPAVGLAGTEVIGAFVGQFAHTVLFGQQFVQKVHGQILVDFLSEDFLEAKIRERIDVPGHGKGVCLRRR